MPRLPPQLVRHAASIDRYLPLLLRECRDLQSARNELRWMREAVAQPTSSRGKVAAGLKTCENVHEKEVLVDFVRRRARGEPLQYILGTQPFGDLEIKCAPGVLIPRLETETYTLKVARILREGTTWLKNPRHLSIVDFCTGSGCIALLLHSILKPLDQDYIPLPFEQVTISAFDISQTALNLAHDNIHHNVALHTLHEIALKAIRVEYLDVLELAQQKHETLLRTVLKRTGSNHIDVIISNPPYISPDRYKPGGEIARSVRNFEPKLALVPPDHICFGGVEQADQFYAALLKIAVVSRAKILVMEVGDTEQAIRVRALCVADRDAYVEIWRDDSSIVHQCNTELSSEPLRDDNIEARVVVVWFDPEWVQWRRDRLIQTIMK